MNIIEQAAKRLEELRRAGVEVPWAAAGFSQPEVRALRENGTVVAASGPAPVLLRPIVESDRPVRHSRELKLDLDRLGREGYLVPNRPRSALADEFRIIKRQLLRSGSSEDATHMKRRNLVQVTSAIAGEGKTFCSINLAMSLAMEVDHSVLLVDADMLRPSVFARMGVNSDCGLMDLLRDRSIDLSDVMFRTNVPKLSLLSSGAGAVNSTELLASVAMEELLEDLATRYGDRIVIFDAPPLLAATEARVLASRVGQVVVVVDAVGTKRATVGEAFATVSNCPTVLSVLNRCAPREALGDYGYGYPNR